MRISLLMRARACAAATLVLSLGLAPSFAHMAGPPAARPARPALSAGHFPRLGFRDFDRFRPGGSKADRFVFDRFGVNRFGSSRWNGFNQLGLAGWGWGGDWGGFDSVPAGQPAPIIVVGGPPALISLNLTPGTGDGGQGQTGACVIHKLIYDRAGKYIGERQSPEC